MKELLEKLGYVPHINGCLVNHKNYNFEFFQKDDCYMCYTNHGKNLFVIPENLSLGASLVLLQEFGIVHERFIYESVDHIEELYNDKYEYDEE